MPMQMRIAATLMVIGSACTPVHRAAVAPNVPLPPSGRTSATETAVLPREASPVSFARMSDFPTPGWQVPRNTQFAPDGKSLTFLQGEDGSEEMALFAMDLSTGEVKPLLSASDLRKTDRPMSVEEELRRERQRIRIKGITNYAWAKRSNTMILPLAGDVWVRSSDGKVTQITDTDAPEIDPQICADGRRVAFVREGELFVYDLGFKREQKLTDNAPSGVTRGLTDFNGQEEFGEAHGFYWSSDCNTILFLEVDERQVSKIPILGYRDDGENFMEQAYPRTGSRNPSVRLGLVAASGGPTTWVEPSAGVSKEAYWVSFRWAPKGDHVFAQAISRDQKSRQLIQINAKTGNAKALFEESSPHWLDAAMMHIHPEGNWFTWTAARDGHIHLEVRESATGKKIAQRTTGAWDVTEIVAVDADEDQILFMASADGATERHLYAVPATGASPVEAPKRITTEPGVHNVAFGRQANMLLDVHSAADRIPRAVVRAMDGSPKHDLAIPIDNDFDELQIRPRELIEVTAPDGTKLHGALLRPRVIRPDGGHPAVLMVYGGPGVQTVRNEWNAALLWQHLADRGFYVLQVDNRGAAGRGPAFETPIYHRLGEIELADQLAALAYLNQLEGVDDRRVGIYGHSYGGFMAAYAMLKAPGRFAVGIAGSPVTQWNLYDTGYTERYMGTPESNPAGYLGSDLGPLAKNLVGDLFIIHALMDENVHFRNTAHLIDALVAADKNFDLLVFPGERHGYRSPQARAYANRRVVEYLVDKLSGAR